MKSPCTKSSDPFAIPANHGSIHVGTLLTFIDHHVDTYSNTERCVTVRPRLHWIA